jgi:hypothetical protein
MVNIVEQITELNAILINHEISYRTNNSCPHPITDILNHIRTTLITTPQSKIYEPIIKVFDEEYEDDIIIDKYKSMIKPMPFKRSYPYLTINHLSKLLKNINSVTITYLSTFTPPQSPAPRGQSHFQIPRPRTTQQPR